MNEQKQPINLTFKTVFGVVTVSVLVILLLDRLVVRSVAPAFHRFLTLDMTFDLPIAKNIPFPAFNPVFVFGVPWLLHFVFLCIYLPVAKKQPFRNGLAAWLQVPAYIFLLFVAVAVGETIYLILEGLFHDKGFGTALKNVGENFQIRAELSSSQFATPIKFPLRLTAIFGLVAGYCFLVNRGVREALIKISPGFFTKK